MLVGGRVEHHEVCRPARLRCVHASRSSPARLGRVARDRTDHFLGRHAEQAASQRGDELQRFSVGLVPGLKSVEPGRRRSRPRSGRGRSRDGLQAREQARRRQQDGESRAASGQGADAGGRRVASTCSTETAFISRREAGSAAGPGTGRRGPWDARPCSHAGPQDLLGPPLTVKAPSLDEHVAELLRGSCFATRGIISCDDQASRSAARWPSGRPRRARRVRRGTCAWPWIG